MKTNTLLKDGGINLAVVALLSLLGACAINPSPYTAKHPLVPARDSSDPVVSEALINGNKVPLVTVYDWAPFEQP